MADTGLKQMTIINEVVEEVLKREKQWLSPTCDAQQRMTMLVDCVFVGLDRLNIPRPDVVYDSSLGQGECGRYNLKEWKLKLNPSYATPQAVERDKEQALRECFDTVYHETRHHEQNFRLFYYLVTRPENKEKIRERVKQRMTLVQALAAGFYGTFAPDRFAQAYASMIVAQVKPSGTELEEARNWYEETYGAHGDERNKVLQDENRRPDDRRNISKEELNRRPELRNTIYSLYRTLFMEDDGWETGYLAGDAYLKRTLERNRGNIEEGERILRRFKEELEASRLRTRDRAAELLSQGESRDAVMKLVQQSHDKLMRDKEKIKKYENDLNGKRKLLEGKQFNADNMIRSHRESMMGHRINANVKRNRYKRTNFLGTASSTGSK
ncbi:MAG: hypothetical protein M3348_09245 [Acidobacteriota bacterium]|nr:hypothetical protein [Acidobacteriota bacterium]